MEDSIFRLGVQNPDYALNEPMLRSVLNGYYIDISKQVEEYNAVYPI